MKIFNKQMRMVFALMASVVWLLGCGVDLKQTGLTEEEMIAEAFQKGSQKTTFLLTDAPSDDFKSVMVDILSPIVVTMNDGTIVNVPLPDDLPLRVDLLELDGVSDLLASADIPAGAISKVALTLANPKIVLLDDTVLGSGDIDLPSPVLTLSPGEAIVIPGGEGITVQIDVDVESSIKVDVTGTGRPLFRPVGNVVRVNETDPDGIEIRQVKGEVVRIPGIPGNPKSFLLKHRGRRHFIQVDADSATIKKFNEEATFDALEPGQLVEVGGIFQHHVLKARYVFILPRDHRALHGVITDLTATSFDLVLLKRHPEGAADMDGDARTDKADITRIKILYGPDTDILLKHPHMRLGPTDLAHGQRVDVRGLVDLDRGLAKANVIVIHPTRLAGVIAQEPACDRHMIYLISARRPFAIPPILERDSATSTPPIGDPDFDLLRVRPDGTGIGWIIDIEKARLISEMGLPMVCSDLKPGMAVKVLGLMLPPQVSGLAGFTGDTPPSASDLPPVFTGGPHYMKAFIVKQVKARHVSGEVISVALDGKGLMLKVPAGMHGFDRLNRVCDRISAPHGLLDENGLEIAITRPCDDNHFNLKVILSEHLYNPDGIIFNETLVGAQIAAAGFFESHRHSDLDTRRHLHFLAIMVKRVPAPRVPAPTVPAPVDPPPPIPTPESVR
jgi:hypothetical protein